MKAKLPAKVPGKHRFVGIATFSVPETEIDDLMKGHFIRSIGMNDIVSIEVGCLDCETELSRAISQPCGAPSAPEFEDVTEAR